MNYDQHPKYKPLIKGYLALGCGVILFILTVLLRDSAILGNYLKLLQGIGVFLAFWGVFMVFQAAIYKKNPATMKKDRIESFDERKIWIRNRAGNNAFIIGTAATYLTLLVVGMTREPINPDLAWWVLAAIVVITLIVFIVSLVWFENKY